MDGFPETLIFNKIQLGRAIVEMANTELSTLTIQENIPVVDRYGFLQSDSRFQKTCGDEKSLKKIWLENQRTQKWIRMAGQHIEHWDTIHAKRHKKIQSRIRKGVPEAFRGRIWRRMVNSCKMLDQNPTLYRDYLTQKDCPNQEAILRDVGRTFPKHLLFVDSMGQSALTNVLSAYSLHDPEVGYCQGMGFISALFLSYMPEDQTFWQLVACMTSKKHALADLYRPGMPKVGETMFVFEKLLEKYLPAVFSHFDKEGVHPTMYASHWFITLFSYSFSFDLVTRIWDIFLYEGWKIIYRVALALLKLEQKQLLDLNFERSMDFFRELPTRMNAELVITTALKIPLRTKEVEALRTQYFNTNTN